jgi:hypothetical protein
VTALFGCRPDSAGSARSRVAFGPGRCLTGLLALEVLLVLGCHHAEKSLLVPDPVAWSCAGTVLHRTDGHPILNVEVWFHGAVLGVTDSAGAYTVGLGASHLSVDTLRFRKADYSDAIGLLNAAQVAGDHRLTLDVTMLLSKEDD